MKNHQKIIDIFVSSFLTILKSPFYLSVIVLYSLLIYPIAFFRVHFSGNIPESCYNFVFFIVGMFASLVVCKRQLGLKFFDKTFLGIWSTIKYFVSVGMIGFLLWYPMGILFLFTNVFLRFSFVMLIGGISLFYFMRYVWLGLPILLNKNTSLSDVLKESYRLLGSTGGFMILLIFVGFFDFIFAQALKIVILKRYPSIVNAQIISLLSGFYLILTVIFQAKLYLYLENLTKCIKSDSN